jgi:hypothetical protein
MTDTSRPPPAETRHSLLVLTPREPLIPLSDDEIASAVRRALGRESTSETPAGAESGEAQGKRVAEHFRRFGLLVFWQRSGGCGS